MLKLILDGHIQMKEGRKFTLNPCNEKHVWREWNHDCPEED